MADTKTATQADVLPGTEVSEYKTLSKEIVAYAKAESSDKKNH